MLDEPLVNLDYKLREELRTELQQIFERRSAVVVYTTTEPAEALMLGGNIVVMDEGRILQAGPTPEVYRHPAMQRVAETSPTRPSISSKAGRTTNRRSSVNRSACPSTVTWPGYLPARTFSGCAATTFC